MNKSKLISMMMVLSLAISLVLSSAGMAFAAYGSSEITVYVNGTPSGDKITVSEIGNDLNTYSTHKGGVQKYYRTKGSALEDLLVDAGYVNNVGQITELTVKATDDWTRTYNANSEITLASLFDGSRKYWPSGGGSVVVPTSIAKAYTMAETGVVADGSNDSDCLRFFLGATSTSDYTNDDMVKYINRIYITK